MRLSESILYNLREEGIPKTKQTMVKSQMINYLKDKLSSIGATLKVKKGSIVITYLGGDLLLRFKFKGRSKTDFTIENYFIKLDNPKNKKHFAIDINPRESAEEIKKCLDDIVEHVPTLRFNTDINNHYYIDSELNRINREYNMYMKSLEDKIKKAKSDEEIIELESQMCSLRDYIGSKYPDQYEDFKDKI